MNDFIMNPTEESLPLLGRVVGHGAVLEERGEDGDDMLLVLLHRHACITYSSCRSGSKLDPYSGALWIRIRIPNTDSDQDK